MNGYPEDPHRFVPTRPIRNGLIFAGAVWLVAFVVLLIAFRT